MSLAFGVFALLFLAVFYASAFDPPVALPPLCPAGTPGCDPPVNVGSGSQSKDGNLGVNALGLFANGLVVVNYLQLDNVVSDPSPADCTVGDPTELGRIILNNADDRLWVCTDAGWKKASLVF